MTQPTIDLQLEHRPPRLTSSAALRIARERYALDAVSAVPLPSDRDQNFRLETAAGERAVLKLSEAGEDPAVLELQDHALERLAAAGLPYRFPRVRPSVDGRRWVEVAAASPPDGDPGVAPGPADRARARPADASHAHPDEAAGRAADRSATHLARLVEWVPGDPLARTRPHGAGLLRGVGELLGRVDRVLGGLEHAAADRPLAWDLRHGREVVAAHIEHVDDPDRRALVRRHVAAFDAGAGPLLDELRAAQIHGDGNDHNLIVSGVAGDARAKRRIAGLIDFGDMVRSWLAAEPAIAAAYVMLDKADPLAAARATVGGYHAANPLTEAEIAALFPLIRLRLCVSVTISARQRRRRPDNEYLTVSEAGAWALLERLDALDAAFAHYALRDACGLPPCPAAERVVDWLEANGQAAAPVLDPDPAAVDRIPLDLSVGSLERDRFDGRDDTDAGSSVLFGRMREAGAAIGIGRYDEARCWYTSDAYRVQTDDGPEWRTVHLGVDLFAEPGTRVHAPFDGRVHSLRDNGGPLDYGPTIVLEHAFDASPGDRARAGAAGIAGGAAADGGGAGGRVRFWTLYGHLSGDSLDGLEPGQAIAAGEPIGRIGSADENGGWAPHLHLQVITDLLGHEATFPGVARPSERSIWLGLCPDPNLLLRLPEGCTAPRPPTPEALVAARRERLGPSLSIAYDDRPLHIVRGWMQHLYDANGQPYLDAVNNVAHVGHSHPRVVDALRRQAAVLNTNTRYLHEKLARYAERLAATLPEPLRVVYLVCSGSEANELALRMARAYTGRRHVVVLDGAYHGNTSSLVEISPYKFDGPGGSGAPDWVHVAAMPDPYRGEHRGSGGDVGRRYAEDVRRALLAAERASMEPAERRTPASVDPETARRLAAGHGSARPGAAAFFCEPLLGCGGQIVPPERYLRAAFEHARAAGAVCVADEVQIGFGRVGTHFWGFEAQGAVPDIVTMGKPIGNGHPLAAVVTTPEIAASFDNGMEYFNTFGGNPVSCAVGLAVLDVIEEERLQTNARDVGERLRDGLRALMDRHAVIGDVRGLGLYIGVELMLDRERRMPAGGSAAYVARRMRDHGILISTDGPDHNVLKIKPPLVFGDSDADRLVTTLDDVLAEDPARAGVTA